MNRREMLSWIKAEICPKLDLSQELDVPEILRVVGRFRTAQHIKENAPMTAEVNEYGHLFINGIHAGQITNKIPRGKHSEEATYWENRILARQESYEI